MSIKYLLCFGKGQKNSGKWVQITTGGKEVTGRCRAEGAGVVQWSDGTQTTVLLVTASLVRKKEPPLNGAPPFSSSLRERDTHTHTQTHMHTHAHIFSFLHYCPVHATRGLKKSL